MQIETKRLTLRPFRVEDADVASHNSMCATAARFMPDMVLATVQDAQRWIEWINGQNSLQASVREPFQILAIDRKADLSLIGFAGVAPKKELDNAVEIGFSIADEYQGNGYATEAGKAMVWWAFEQAGQDELSAVVQPENKASLRVVEKLGFVHCDTRTLPYNGTDCCFECYRLYHTDYLPGPEWDAKVLYKLEAMAAFFDARAQGYNAHMLSDGGEEDYDKLGNFLPETNAPVEILDIGCGTGIELAYVWEKMPNAQVTCVDLSGEMLELLQARYVDRTEQITVYQASYLAWDYPAARFDLVISSATLHHLWPEEKLEVYRRIHDTLKEGGVYLESDFIVNEAQAEQYRRRYAMILAVNEGKASAGEFHLDIPCTLETQVTLLRDAGFRNVEVLDEHIRPRGSGAILRASKCTKENDDAHSFSNL